MSSELCSIIENNGTVRCYLTDQFGFPLPTNEGVECAEVDPNRRREVSVTLPSGERTILQEVTLFKRGFVVIEAFDDRFECVSEPIPFSFTERVLLCAPRGTDVTCTITEFDCLPNIVCRDGELVSIEIGLRICQEIKSVYNTVIDLATRACQPREALSESCPPPTTLSTKNRITNTGEQQTFEQTCISTEKVYDWIIQDTNQQIRVDDVSFTCGPCQITLFVPAVIMCDRQISGTVLCNGERIANQEVFISVDPDIADVNPNPTVTDENGHFFTTLDVPVGTEPTIATVTATTTIDQHEFSISLDTILVCESECQLFLFGPSTIDCIDVVEARVRCNDEVIAGANVTFESDRPDLISFDPNPATTGVLGVALTTVNVEPGTPPTQVTITARTTVDGEDLEETIVLTVVCEARECTITIEAPALITCEGEITGTVTCDGIPVEDAVVEFNNFPIVGEFDPNPATTDALGNYSTTLTVPESTPLISTVIMATTTVNGETITAMISIHIECPLEECPCKYRIGIQGNAAPATVNVTQQSTPSTFQGTINVTAIQCFTANAICNPAINNFNIAFGSGGNTINFVMGRRISIQCDGNNFARVHGVANAIGNVINGIFDVLIELQISPANIGTWTIIASDLHGNSFSTTFSAPVSSATFIGDCSVVP